MNGETDRWVGGRGISVDDCEGAMRCVMIDFGIIHGKCSVECLLSNGNFYNSIVLLAGSDTDSHTSNRCKATLLRRLKKEMIALAQD